MSMQPEDTIKPDVEVDSADSNIVVADSISDSPNARPPSNDKPSSAVSNGSTQGRFPPPKTDKPRPHVCGTCGRSFARLEHLKRHERSHTKEKPFECPECSRCFARRDLLLRHQQKLHATNPASSRPRSGRRESVSSASVAGSRVRKNSVANANLNGAGAMGGAGAGGAGVRPRANTISHIDLSNLGFADNMQPNMSRMNALGLGAHNGMGAGMGNMGFDYRGLSTAMGHHGNVNGLPKLDTSAINDLDMSNSLRTAPPQASFGGFHVDQIFGPGTTINPAQLHFGGSGQTTQPNLPAMEPFTAHSAIEPGTHSDDFGWMRNWNMQMPFDGGDEHAIEESSPSRMSSSDSPAEFPDAMNNHNPGIAIPNNLQWPPNGSPSHGVSSAPFQLDGLSNGLPNLDGSQGMISPNTIHDPTPRGDNYFHQAMMQQQQHQPHQQQMNQNEHAPADVLQGGAHASNIFPPSLSNFSSDSPSIMSSSSMGGSARQSSVTSASSLSITDVTRQALLHTLNRSTGGSTLTRKYSQPTVSSPLSPNARRSPLPSSPTLPGTDDIRRYVDAFIQYAHPHLPVTHIPTLSFDPLDFGIGKGPSTPSNPAQAGILIGGGCLILGMAAIGALYEYEHAASKELFEAAKRMIHIYLDERRKPQISAAVSGVKADDAHQTPLWLVQAMLLTVIYGHMCGDRTAADIASTHCAALVGLARAAKLAEPPQSPSPGGPDQSNNMQQQQQQQQQTQGDLEMCDDGITPADSISRHQSQETDLHSQWINWKVAEERKRTLFAIFILSSLLTTAYNQNPTIMNSEILLDLPCDEELFKAETAEKWQERGGLAAADMNAVSFAGALSNLLTANQRQAKNGSARRTANGPFGALRDNETFDDNDLRPSTFGCLVLINALHNYIWETRSRHHGRQWTAQETESMFSHIEPALNAWQAAWKANDQHRLERPNPLGLGPLAADSIPLLDQAFVRLFVNLGASKEAFWRRDFDAMAKELSHGTEIVQHADGSPDGGEAGPAAGGRNSSKSPPGSNNTNGNANGNGHRHSLAPPSEQASSRRERHLRKAAFYAADSLTIACNYNLTYADMMAHELPIQSAMCFFDCCQVLAEWACTVQERVGKYIGVLGRDQIDLSAVPAIMLLENEDIELFRKIEVICDSLENKRLQQENLLQMDTQYMSGVAGAAMGMNVALQQQQQNAASLALSGYGSRLLRITGVMLEKAIVWPITLVMAQSLRTQAEHMDKRSEASTTS